MRIVIALVFAVLATAAMFSLPYWPLEGDASLLVSGPEVSLAERFVADLRSHNFTGVLAIMEPDNRPKDTAILSMLSGLFPKRHEDALRVTAWHKLSIDAETTTRIETFYEFGKDGAIRCQFIILDTGHGLVVRGADIRSITRAQLGLNDFKLPATPWDLRWAYLLVGVLFDLFAFATFALCLMSPVVRWRWRWLWALFVLAGAVRFNLDWVSLAFDYQLVSLLAPPAGFYKFFAYGSWVLSLSAPIGASLYWGRRAQWRNGGDDTVAAGDMRG